MLHLRVVAPPDLVEPTLHLLRCTPSVTNVVHLPGASQEPAGDLITCDVAREDGSVVLEDLRELGLERDGSIAVETVESTLSEAAERAEDAAAGVPADAVVWEEVEARTSEETELSFSFVAFVVLAMLIAMVGVMLDSTILIIGAMVVGPEFGPLAGFCVAVVQRRPGLARKSVSAFAVGFPVAIAATYVGVVAARASGLAPDSLNEGAHPETLFIADPNRWTAIAAVLAGIAGMISLTTAKSGALMGVLISITTIPAAGNVGLAAAYENWDECAGALAQLGINLGSLMVAGVATLTVQRALYARRRREHRRVVAATAEDVLR